MEESAELQGARSARLKLFEEIDQIRNKANREIAKRLEKIREIDATISDALNAPPVAPEKTKPVKIKPVQKELTQPCPILKGPEAAKFLEANGIKISPKCLVYANKNVKIACKNGSKEHIRMTTPVGRNHCYIKSGAYDHFDMDRKTLNGVEQFDVQILFNAKLVKGRYIGDLIIVVPISVYQSQRVISSQYYDSDLLSDTEKGLSARLVSCTLPGTSLVIKPHSNVIFPVEPVEQDDGSYLVKFVRKRATCIVGYVSIAGQPWISEPI